MSAQPTLRVLVVDDEPLARQRIEDLLESEEDVDLVASIASGRAAVEAIRQHDPDLVFLDVQMPGMTGVQVVEAVGAQDMPMVIFVTAYDQYALQAFDVAAIDYLLKPFDDERFEKALNRARQTIALRDVDALRSRLDALVRGIPGAADSTAGPPRYIERVAVEMRGRSQIVDVQDVDYITASGPYAELHVGDNKYLLRERMQTLEDRLDPGRFFRIHRSTIVRLDLVDALLYSAGGDYALRLKDGRRLKVSRGRREELEERLGLDALR